MRERPLLFSAAMVRANREDRKTQTRRNRGLDKINSAPDTWTLVGQSAGDPSGYYFQQGDIMKQTLVRCPYGVAGDRLYVKETWRTSLASDSLKPSLLPLGSPIYYEVDCPDWQGRHSFIGKTRVSIFMPRWASRDTLELVSVRPERLRSITKADSLAEGIQVLPLQSVDDPSAWYQSSPGVHQERSAEQSYFRLWDAINGHRPVLPSDPKSARYKTVAEWLAKHPDVSSARNPWLWRLEYRRVKRYE